MNLEKFREAEERDEISIERFYGQTVLYIPESIGDVVAGETIWGIVKEYFSEDALNGFSGESHKLEPKKYGFEISGDYFYSVEFPSVINLQGEPSIWTVADDIVAKILEEYQRLKKD
ncbi:hypothetical protein HYT55_00685 [Candidatus Woesearchaeota archaeon]|nr:hypothetical protein [Candidatus Woesearchaeota archaeon]